MALESAMHQTMSIHQTVVNYCAIHQITQESDVHQCSKLYQHVAIHQTMSCRPLLSSSCASDSTTHPTLLQNSHTTRQTTVVLCTELPSEHKLCQCTAAPCTELYKAQSHAKPCKCTTVPHKNHVTDFSWWHSASLRTGPCIHYDHDWKTSTMLLKITMLHKTCSRQFLPSKVILWLNLGPDPANTYTYV